MAENRNLVSVGLGKYLLPQVHVDPTISKTVARLTSLAILAGLVYLAIGVGWAASHDKFAVINTMDGFFTAIFSVLLWPFPAVGIDITVVP